MTHEDTLFPNPDSLHRGVKMAIDAGEVETVEAGMALFQRYRLAVLVGPEVAYSLPHQAALLTIVNTARRALLGGIQVRGRLDVPLLVPLPGDWRDLAHAVRGLQGEMVETVDDDRPCLLLGEVAADDRANVNLVVSFDGWRGGVWPQGDRPRLPERPDSVLAAVMAAAAGVSEIFQNLRGFAIAGHRTVGMSLWAPKNDDWYTMDDGPREYVVPTCFWILGLGHLGQAYVWALSMLPFQTPGDVVLTLQDFDRATQANESTSVLTESSLIGRAKTRLVGDWAERRGFRARLVERAFVGDVRLADKDPRILLCGVDNPQARALMETAGFDLVVEAGLGGGPKEYLAIRMHCFPASRTSEEIWGGLKHEREVVQAPAYESLAKKGAEACGLVELASRTVGAPFVGVFAATLVIGETIRRLNGGSATEVLDMTLRAPETRTVVATVLQAPAFNPGFASLKF